MNIILMLNSKLLKQNVLKNSSSVKDEIKMKRSNI